MLVRFKAFSWHLLGSVFIVLLTLFLVFKVWYPAPFDEAVGVTRIFLLLVMVDVLLGPLLTFVIYKKGKKTLIFDMAVIVILQFAALSYGLWTVAEGRPAWVVFNVDRFDLVRALDIDNRRLQEARPQYQIAPWWGPQWVGAAAPEDAEQNSTLLFESVLGGSDIAQQPNLYRPLKDMASAWRGRAHDLAELGQYNSPEQVGEILARWPAADAWLPLMAGAKPMTVLVDKRTSSIVAVVDLAPWG